MLIENVSTLSGKVASIKLITGEEIITHVRADDGGALTIVNPLAMVMMPGEEQEGMVVFAPWMLGLDDDTAVVLPRDKYLIAVEARRDASAQYVGAVGDSHVVTEKAAPQILTGARKGGRGR